MLNCVIIDSGVSYVHPLIDQNSLAGFSLVFNDDGTMNYENDFNQKIAEMLKNKSVIFISHRLTTTRMADVIYVMDKGQVAECGTHQELLEKRGIYYKMWHIQADSYANVN